MLLVDDDDFMRAVLTRLFVDDDIPVQAFGSVAELLESPGPRSRAVLLVDLRMPVVASLNVQRLLHERQVVLPVIFFAGAYGVPLAVAGMPHGTVDFIERPFDRGALVARVRRIDARHRDRGLSIGRGADPGHGARLASLTPREHEVLRLMVTGQTSKMMARELGGSFRTIEIHRSRVMIKMAATSLADLVRMTLTADALTG